MEDIKDFKERMSDFERRMNQFDAMITELGGNIQDQQKIIEKFVTNIDSIAKENRERMTTLVFSIMNVYSEYQRIMSLAEKISGLLIDAGNKLKEYVDQYKPA